MTKENSIILNQFTETQPVSPMHLIETSQAYQRTEALKAAIELDLFTAIAEGTTSAVMLALRCGTPERGIRILCDYLVVIGFLTKQEDRYFLTADSAVFLNRNSPGYLGTAVKFFTSPIVTEGFKDLEDTIRKGVPGTGLLTLDHPIWVEFARAMAPLTRLPAELLAKLVNTDAKQKQKILDIAAGHGLLGITLAKHNPLAEIVAVDSADVLAIAKENAEAAGVADRYQTISGSAFEVAFGNDYDIVLVANFLHGFDTATCERLLLKIYAALKPGGKVVALESIPNDDRVSPPAAAAFSLSMLANTPSGDAHTFTELAQMFRNAGFSSCDLHDLPPTPLRLVIALKSWGAFDFSSKRLSPQFSFSQLGNGKI